MQIVSPAVEIAGLNVRVAGVNTNGAAISYPVYGVQRRNTVLVSVSPSF